MGPHNLGKGKGPGKKNGKKKIEGPIQETTYSYPIESHKRQSRSDYVDPNTVPMRIQDKRSKYVRSEGLFADNTVNFDVLNKDKNTDQFIQRFNSPATRELMKKNNPGLKDYDIDNMMIRGLEAKDETGNVRNQGAGAEYSYYDNATHKEENVIRTAHEHKHDTAKNMHERVHASGFDSLQGDNLLDVLGSSFQNKQRNAGRTVNRYMNKPYEAYGNFVEFRENLGLKPGEQITEKELKNRVKAKGLEHEHFYKAFDDKNIMKALNTIAANGEGPANPKRIRNTYDV